MRSRVRLALCAPNPRNDKASTVFTHALPLSHLCSHPSMQACCDQFRNAQKLRRKWIMRSLEDKSFRLYSGQWATERESADLSKRVVLPTLLLFR